MKRNCTFKDIPKVYNVKCITNELGSFYRPYTLDVKSMDSDICELDGPVDTDNAKTDQACSACEAGNYMTFSLNL